MFNYKNKIIAELNLETLWNMYAKVENWHKWDTSIEKVDLSSDFDKNAEGVMFVFNMPPLNFTLIDVSKDKSFITSANIEDVTITFGHYITKLDDNKFEIEHTVDITAQYEAKAKGIGENITKTIPQAMKNLVELSK